MQTIKELLERKGTDVWSIGPEETVFDAIRVMADKEVGALLVLDRGLPVGIVSERDYTRKVILKGRASNETKIREIMTTKVVYAHPEQTINECMALMTQKHIRHLPIIDDGKVQGMISIGDLVKTTIAEQRFVIRQLENYIHGVTT